MKKSETVIASALVLGLLGAAGTAQAATYSIANMNITGGGFGVVELFISPGRTAVERVILGLLEGEDI